MAMAETVPGRSVILEMANEGVKRADAIKSMNDPLSAVSQLVERTLAVDFYLRAAREKNDPKLRDLGEEQFELAIRDASRTILDLSKTPPLLSKIVGNTLEIPFSLRAEVIAKLDDQMAEANFVMAMHSVDKKETMDYLKEVEKLHRESARIWSALYDMFDSDAWHAGVAAARGAGYGGLIIAKEARRERDRAEERSTYEMGKAESAAKLMAAGSEYIEKRKEAYFSPSPR